MQPSHTMHSYAMLVMCDRLHCQYILAPSTIVTGVEIEAGISTPGLLMMFKTQPVQVSLFKHISVVLNIGDYCSAYAWRVTSSPIPSEKPLSSPTPTKVRPLLSV